MKSHISLLITLLAYTSAHANRFVEDDLEGSSLPVWVGTYIVLGIVALVHERSPLKKWAEQNPLTAFATFLALPLLLLFKKLLALVFLIVVALVFFLFFRGRKDSSSEDQGIHEKHASRKPCRSTILPEQELGVDLLADKEESMELGLPNTSWPYVDVCIYYAKNFSEDYLIRKVQDFRTKIGVKYPGEFDPPEWMSFEFLSEDFPREQEIYDVLFDYIIDGQYPNYLVRDGLELKVEDVSKELPIHMIKFFKPLELLNTEEYEEAVFIMAMYKAMQMIKRHDCLRGVNLQYGV